MHFESCSDDPQSANTLTSPEVNLQSDEQLTFKTISPNSGNNGGLALHVYRTEDARHPAMLLGTFSLSNTTADDNSTTFHTNPPVVANGTEEANETANHYNYNYNYNFDYNEPVSDESSSFTSYAEMAHSVCLPAGTYQLVFIAGETDSAWQSQVAVTDVLLTRVSCTHNRSAGKRRPLLTRASEI